MLNRLAVFIVESNNPSASRSPEQRITKPSEGRLYTVTASDAGAQGHPVSAALPHDECI
jgi:hypothetical protein